MRENITRESMVRKFVKDNGYKFPVEREDFVKYYLEVLGDTLNKESFDTSLTEYSKEDLNNLFDLEIKVIDKLLSELKENSSYKNLIELKNNELVEKYPLYKLDKAGSDLYKEYNDGKYFVSVDLKSANFQALKYVGVLNSNNYEDLIIQNGGNESLAKSKKTRQVLFGKLNQKKITHIQKHLISKVHNKIKSNVKDINYNLEVFNRDELVYSLESKEELEKFMHSLQNLVTDIDISLEGFKLVKLSWYGYVKEYFDDSPVTFHKVSKVYFMEAYKLYKGLPLDERDFYMLSQDRELYYRLETKDDLGRVIKTKELIKRGV